jgi:hypothetical protein
LPENDIQQHKNHESNIGNAGFSQSQLPLRRLEEEMLAVLAGPGDFDTDFA